MELTELGLCFQNRRRELKLTQDGLAEMSGITTRSIYNIEEGIGNPSFKTLSKLADILGLNINIKIKSVD